MNSTPKDIVKRRYAKAVAVKGVFFWAVCEEPGGTVLARGRTAGSAWSSAAAGMVHNPVRGLSKTHRPF